MQEIFLTRREHDKLCGMWTINGEEHKAYLFGKRRKWTLAGVTFKTSNKKLLELVAKVKQSFTK